MEIRSFISTIIFILALRKTCRHWNAPIKLQEFQLEKQKKVIHDTTFKACTFNFHTKWLSNKVCFSKRSEQYLLSGWNETLVTEIRTMHYTGKDRPCVKLRFGFYFKKSYSNALSGKIKKITCDTHNLHISKH